VILDTVHHRQLQEHKDAGNMVGAVELADAVPVPLLRLVHGLPGAGKTQVLLWLVSYFTEVWNFEQDEDFALIAPLNSMASNIGGATVHSFGGISFKDRRGIVVNSKQQRETEETSTLTYRWSKLRWLFMDEIEATGADIFGQLSENLRLNVPDATVEGVEHYKFEDFKTRRDVRQFAGINVIAFGDFFQLDPTGSKAFMSNPYDQRTSEQATIRLSMNTFWCPGTLTSSWELQPWSRNDKSCVVELAVNKRSGEDIWFSDVLDECRAGDLSEDNYNFLHGYPTSVGSIRFWYHRRKESPPWHCTCEQKSYQMDFANFGTAVASTAGAFECQDCQQERFRRKRVLNMQAATLWEEKQLNELKFQSCILITPFNRSVFHFALQRALNLAASMRMPLFWMQAVDTPPSWYSNGLSKEDLEAMKRRWLSYHARKTEGILSLCPAFYDMPIRVLRGNGANFKEFGIHNGTTGACSTSPNGCPRSDNP